MLLARRSFEHIGVHHRHPNQRSFDHFDGQEKGQQNVPPSHDQSLVLGPGKLMRFYKLISYQIYMKRLKHLDIEDLYFISYNKEKMHNY